MTKKCSHCGKENTFVFTNYNEDDEVNKTDLNSGTWSESYLAQTDGCDCFGHIIFSTIGCFRVFRTTTIYA